MQYDPKNMQFRPLGNTGLRVSLLSFGGWLTLGGSVPLEGTQALIKQAFEAGINTFDTAEIYANGAAEETMGQAIKNLGIQREDLVLITKIFFGTGGKTPNSRGLSRKHIIEGARASLKRMGVEYFDVIMAHRADVSVPMEETVRAFNHLIDTGVCFYWGTSEWSAAQIMEAHAVAARLGLVGPCADQTQYSALHRERVEAEYAPLYKQPYSLGLTIWSPLASGVLTGKYNDGIPAGSRFDKLKETFDSTIKSLQTDEGKAKIAKVKKLTTLAEEIGAPSVASLALAWTARNAHVSTVILGASKPEQLTDNLQAMDVLPKLTDEVMEKIEKILENKPEQAPTFGR